MLPNCSLRLPTTMPAWHRSDIESFKVGDDSSHYNNHPYSYQAICIFGVHENKLSVKIFSCAITISDQSQWRRCFQISLSIIAIFKSYRRRCQKKLKLLRVCTLLLTAVATHEERVLSYVNSVPCLSKNIYKIFGNSGCRVR